MPPEVQLSDFALLAYTGAKLPSDGFSLVDSLDDTQSARDFLYEVAGYRYHSVAQPPVGAATRLVAEPTNPRDPHAIAIYVADHRVGYVNRLHTSAFSQWIRGGRINAAVEKLNGSLDRPKLFLFIRVARAEEVD